MGKFTFLIVTLIISITFSGCFKFGQNINFSHYRIEGFSINKIFLGDKVTKNIHAVWKDSKVIVFYDTTNSKTNETSTIELIFDGQDEVYYQNDSGIEGKIVSMNSDRALSVQEIEKLDEAEKSKLVFIVFEQDENDPYYNMVLIPGGTFNMGSRKSLDEIPVHRITINDFYMDKYEVSVLDYIKFCRATKRNFPQQPFWNKDNHPIVNVTWKDAKAYAKWAGKRLPTEAEWEYAARSGAKGNWFAWGNVKPNGKKGDNIADEAVRSEYSSWNYWEGYYDGFVYTSPVGSFFPNNFGLYDMGGNVKEWCFDKYGKGYYKTSPRHNPRGPKRGTRRILRGGSWNYGPGDVRLTKRYRFKPTLKLNYIGFRCVKDVE